MHLRLQLKIELDFHHFPSPQVSFSSRVSQMILQLTQLLRPETLMIQGCCTGEHGLSPPQVCLAKQGYSVHAPFP